MPRHKLSKPDKRHERRKLSTSQILEARHRYFSTTPQPTIERLAQLYEVSYNTMWRAIRSQAVT